MLLSSVRSSVAQGMARRKPDAPDRGGGLDGVGHTEMLIRKA